MPPLAVIAPVTVSDVRVPTEVKLEVVTPEPNVVAVNTLVPFIL